MAVTAIAFCGLLGSSCVEQSRPNGSAESERPLGEQDLEQRRTFWDRLSPARRVELAGECVDLIESEERLPPGRLSPDAAVRLIEGYFNRYADPSTDPSIGEACRAAAETTWEKDLLESPPRKPASEAEYIDRARAVCKRALGDQQDGHLLDDPEGLRDLAADAGRAARALRTRVIPFAGLEREHRKLVADLAAVAAAARANAPKVGRGGDSEDDAIRRVARAQDRLFDGLAGELGCMPG